jgi:hypothetical protein
MRGDTPEQRAQRAMLRALRHDNPHLILEHHIAHEIAAAVADALATANPLTPPSRGEQIVAAKERDGDLVLTDNTRAEVVETIDTAIVEEREACAACVDKMVEADLRDLSDRSRVRAYRNAAAAIRARK